MSSGLAWNMVWCRRILRGFSWGGGFLSSLLVWSSVNDFDFVSLFEKFVANDVQFG